ncbi:unnamed protein product [Brachionus calyciflorus]|uniref:Uncharacterized protein n=1 Tax=Brachionus calyciflorus TaxID=104777 RepID=A0A813M347_9BILA|nr:unnamed protein product [Brachionus calyciflorus]
MKGLLCFLVVAALFNGFFGQDSKSDMGLNVPEFLSNISSIQAQIVPNQDQKTLQVQYIRDKQPSGTQQKESTTPSMRRTRRTTTTTTSTSSSTTSSPETS